MLELIFRGFFEWIYSLIVDMWGFIAGGLLDIMGLDFAYLQSHIPIMDDMAQVLLAAGWALLLGNLVFQALKSMAAGLGFEGEDPRLLFARTFVFAFLLLASPQICRIGLDLTSNIMELLSIPDATNVSLLDESIFGTLTASWVMAIICSVIVMFKVLKLVIEIAERYVILAMLALTAPLAFAMGGSKNTAGIFTGWCRMFGSMCLLMVTNLVCFKMLFSVVSTVPSGFDVLPWMVLIFAIVKVAHKSDEIITRIGLNPALTGGGGRTLLGTVVNTAVRTVTSQATKSVMGRLGFGSGASDSGARSGGTGPNAFRFGSRFSAGGGGRFSGVRGGGRSSGSQASGSGSQDSGRPGGSFGGRQGGGRPSGSQTSGDGSQNFGGTRGGGRYTYHSAAQQTDTRQENSSQTSDHTGNTNTASSNTPRGGGRPQQDRRSSVPPGGQRPRSYVPPSGNPAGGQTAPGAAGTSQKSGSPRPGSVETAPRSGASRPGGAGTAPKGSASKPPNGPQPGAAGTGASRSTHSTTQSTGGSTVNNTSRTSTQTTVHSGGGRPGSSAAKASSGSPRTPRPGGPTVPKSGGKRDGAPPPGGAGKPSRSTQRPDGSPSRPGRNAASTSAAPPAGGTSSGPAPQERTHSSGHSPGSGTSSSPARQEGRSSHASAAPPVKGGAPNVCPGGAGTASTGKQAAGQPRTASARTTRAKPVHRPPPNRRGGNGHG